jgi:hypothetical protein
MAGTTPELKTMEKTQIEDILKRLGFFHVREVDNGPLSDFCVGHMPSAPFLALSRSKDTGALSGPYAELVERLGPVFSRYAAESDDIVMLPIEMRQAWIANLANEAQLTTNELKLVVMSSVRE